MTTERLSGLDATFLYLETSTLHMHVALTAVFDPSTIPGGYSFARLRHLIAERIPQAPVFQRRLVQVPFRLGHPLWVDDPEFDIDNHLRRAALPSPGGMAELAEFAADIDSRQLSRDRPLWEMWVIEGLADGNMALLAKMHHSTVDGVSGAALLAILFDLSPDPPEPGPEEERNATSMPERVGHIPSEFELVSQAVLARLVQPFELVGTAWRTAGRVLGVRRIRMHETAGKAALPLTAPRTSINAAISGRRRVAYNAISLADVKRLKNSLGCTVNDVVLALCTGALRDYLIDGDELPDQPLVAVVPVSVDPESHGAAGTNKVSAMFVQLPTQVADPLERVRLIQDGTKGAKLEHQALGAETLQDWAEYAAPNTFALAARLYTSMRLADRHRPIANVVISNVPGPSFPLYLGGAEMVAAFPLGPVMDGMGLNITIMSYQGVVCWGLVACSRAVPRLDEMAAHVSTALAELSEAAGVTLEQPVMPLGFVAGPELHDAPGPGGSHRNGGAAPMALQPEPGGAGA